MKTKWSGKTLMPFVVAALKGIGGEAPGPVLLGVQVEEVPVGFKAFNAIQWVAEALTHLSRLPAQPPLFLILFLFP